MIKVEIYTRPTCHFCTMAKNELMSRDLDFIEYELSDEITKRTIEARLKKINNDTVIYTVPQIFINDKYIGGYTDLMATQLNP